MPTSKGLALECTYTGKQAHWAAFLSPEPEAHSISALQYILNHI